MTEADPKVSVIIPSLDGYRDGNVPRLLEDLKRQTFQDFEVHVIKGVKPLSRARNEGARISNGEILVFIDDDIRLDSPEVIENLVKVFGEYENIGMAGASIRTPPDSTWFERRSIREIRRGEFPVVEEVVDSDMAGGCGMAIPRELYFEVGQQHEGLIRGEDGEFRHRLKALGYRVVIAPNTWSYHPGFRSFQEMVRGKFWDGVWGAHDFIYHPHLIYEYGDTLATNFVAQRGFCYRAFRYVGDRLLLSLITFRFVRLLYYAAYGLGCVCGFVRYGWHRDSHETKDPQER